MNNKKQIRLEIERKMNPNVPYYASSCTISNGPITDYDHFPYKRNFRGIYNIPSPVALEREAGWRPRVDSCYKELVEPVTCNKNYCWQYPCSTVFPCKKDPAETGKGCKKNKCERNFVLTP
jgi:hypothetical protein